MVYLAIDACFHYHFWVPLVVVIPIAEYVEDEWGQCVNVRIAAWMNSVSMVRRAGKEWPISEECKNAVMPWE